jgi:hypothetical protein
MSELVKKENLHERRTYLKGRFKGKYWALIDDELSDRKRENYYKIESMRVRLQQNEIASI